MALTFMAAMLRLLSQLRNRSKFMRPGADAICIVPAPSADIAARMRDDRMECTLPNPSTSASSHKNAALGKLDMSCMTDRN
jgi:hypothetical protein